MDCPDLKAAADDFFELHFTEVYKLDEFLQLDVKQLTHLLHQDKLTIRAEAQVHFYTSFEFIYFVLLFLGIYIFFKHIIVVDIDVPLLTIFSAKIISP